MKFAEGDTLVLAGVGVVRIEELGEPIVAFGGEDERYELSASVLESKARSLSTVEVANQARRLRIPGAGQSGRDLYVETTDDLLLRNTTLQSEKRNDVKQRNHDHWIRKKYSPLL